MAHHQDTALISQKRPFQFLFCLHIQMIGRLVQDQQIALPVNKFAEAQFRLLSAA